VSKLINYTYFDPNDSLFKSKSSDRETVTGYYCSNSENCDAHKDNRCVLLNNLTNHGCPYGEKRKQYGYTKNAKKCGDLISNMKKTYPDLGWKLNSVDRICVIGEYVFLPVAFLKNYNNPFNKVEISYGNMVKKVDFTANLVVELVKYRPKALMGGVITDYEKTYIPKLASQIKRYMPELYKEVLDIYPYIEGLASQFSFKGKNAKVKTLSPGRVEIGSYLFDWDGTVLTAANGAGSVLGTWNKLTDEILTIIPKDDTVVRVVDEITVNDNTVLCE